ncbi:MAG: Zn-dependent protease [Bacillales bacterium]|jgi:Zn-dependent membrane protease YugP|nr:Zn-dependent protease [Bacillales bacterium]
MGNYLIYLAIVSIIPLVAQLRVKRAFATYSKVASTYGLSGAEVARKVLDSNGLYDVRVEAVNGYLNDHYDPRKKVVRLSAENYNSRSLASTAIAAHECGHALQDAENYGFLRLRSALVPIASFGSNVSWVLIMIGILATISNLVLLGIIFMFGAVLFQIVTLPVEFNASSRAMDQVVSLGIIQNAEERNTKKVLSAAAMTYVAAAAVAILELLRLILIFTGMNRSDD